jgi:hypothetical protein
LIDIRPSAAAAPSSAVQELTRRPRQSNSEWLGKALAKAEGAGTLLLLGGTSRTSFHLRVAQSRARQDLLPSFWSHVAVISGKKGSDWRLLEISLEPRAGFGDVPPNNGVQEGLASAYDDPAAFPNIAVLSVNVDNPAVSLAEAFQAVRHQRRLADLPTILIDWLGFVWGATAKGNPLLNSIGIPSAVFAEAVYAVMGVELTPGLSTQAACPEAIWQAAKWWHAFYASTASRTAGPLSGRYFVGQPAAAAAG